MNMNSLTQQFTTTHDTAPFSKIKNDDFIPAFEIAIEAAKKEIEDIADSSTTPTFENTLEALAYSGMQLDRVSSIFFNLHSAETNDEIEDIAQEIAPKLAAFGNDITLNPKLFKRIKAVYDIKDTLTLSPEQDMLLTTTYKSFVRNGALLNDEDQQKLRALDNELSVVKLEYGKNILADQKAYRMHLTDENDLK